MFCVKHGSVYATSVVRNILIAVTSKKEKLPLSVTHPELAKEADGWDPKDPDYWDELDSRLQKALPHRYNDSTDSNSTVRKPRNVVGSSGREASAAYGGTNRTQFVLTPERVNAMKEVGAWDNPVRKQKMIENFIKFDRQNKNRN